MSIPWGPALEAEVDYRRQQARSDYRPWTWRRKSAQQHPAQAAAQHIPAQHIPARHIPAQQPPARRAPGPLLPIPSRH